MTGTFDRPALHHELTSEDIWVIASDLLQAIQSRGTAKAGLSCDQQLHYFIPLASVAAGLEVPRRWARVVLSARLGCCVAAPAPQGAVSRIGDVLCQGIHLATAGLDSPTKQLLWHTWVHAAPSSTLGFEDLPCWPERCMCISSSQLRLLCCMQQGEMRLQLC